VEPLALFIHRFRYPWAVLLLILTGVFATHTEGLDLDNTLTAWFPEDDPDYHIYREFQDDFSGNRNLVIAVEAEDVFSPHILDYITITVDDIEEVDFVDRVHSITNASRVTGTAEGIEVKPLLYGRGDGGLAEIREYSLSNEMFRDDLVSRDGTLTTILVTFDEENADRERTRLLSEIRAIMENDPPRGIRVYYSGSMEISKEYDRFTLQNQRTFTPPLIVLIVLSILLLFRSIVKLMIILFVIAASLAWTVGIYSLMGYSFNVISGMLIPLIVILSISDSIHILEYHDEVSVRSTDPKRRFVGTLAYIIRPCLATSLTTAFGLLSLLTSRVPAVQTFGLGAAAGILSAFLISIVFVPLFLSIVPARFHHRRESVWIGPLRSLHRFTHGHATPLCLLMILVSAAAIFGAARLEVNTNQMEFFHEESHIRRTADLFNDRLSGVFSVELHLRGEADSMKEPEVLRAMEHLSGRLLDIPHVRKTTSLADHVKMINRELHGGDPAAYEIPDRRDLVAQELFLLFLSDRGRDDLLDIVASDYSRSRMTVKMESMSSDELVHICRRIGDEARAVFRDTGVTPVLTGSGQLFSHLDRYLVESQIRSFTLAFVLVNVFMFVFFRSWKYGALSILPNLFPIFMVLGLMGFTGITLNVATVTVSSVALGIAADDTIHFISRFKRERRERGRDRTVSLEDATVHTGRAIVSTSLINILVFSILILSDFVPTVYFGSLVALTMVFALVGDLVFLPTSIQVFRRKWTNAG
jgi:predicted RND superfamily exporter protein